MGRDPAITHKIMSSIKSKDTKPEMLLRRALWQQGYRYRINYKKLPGRPDIVFTRARIVIFCDGDFWHGHNWAIRGIPSLEDELSSYSDFWKKKIKNNIDRDRRNTELLSANGWTVIRLWESTIKSDLDACVSVIINQYQHNINESNKNKSTPYDLKNFDDLEDFYYDLNDDIHFELDAE